MYLFKGIKHKDFLSEYYTYYENGIIDNISIIIEHSIITKLWNLIIIKDNKSHMYNIGYDLENFKITHPYIFNNNNNTWHNNMIKLDQIVGY